ncbi:proline-rich protein PRCC [Protobothrops mucrosquamatus]|uniref:proline-rich protein PRCC n=1 Tax=Protobothrops mucrosquamatus TaxID=103944 RepID=UPI000775BCDC|nr:proline-rich protein PRCC [Protobothrops mucrosquamatus]
MARAEGRLQRPCRGRLLAEQQARRGRRRLRLCRALRCARLQGPPPAPGSSHAWLQRAEAPGGAGAAREGYYGGGYYPESDPGLGPPPEGSADAAPSSFMDDEAFKRLQGKRNRGREEINFVEIKGDDQLSGVQQWLTKSLTEEQNMKSFSKKKGEQPTGQQRRKHQITYLIHQAKERELELKNSWAENKLSRRQTQAKYGF